VRLQTLPDFCYNARELPLSEKDPDLNFFGKFGKIITYKKGEVILRPSENPTGILYIKKGLVRLYSVSSSGQEITFNIYKPGSYLLMMWALSEVENNYFFETLTEVKGLMAPKDEAVEFLKNQPELLYRLTKRTMIGLEGIVQTSQALLFGNVHSKIATVFLMLARRFGKKGRNGQIVISAPLTHRLIATLAGLTRETASLEIEKLEEEKVISRRKYLYVVNKLKKLESEIDIATQETPVSI